jgi:hypothetical protein
MDETQPEPEDGSQPERGTGQRQDHRAAPPGHEIPREPDDLDDAEGAERDEEEQGASPRETS